MNAKPAVSLSALFAVTLTLNAAAQIDDVTWEDPEVVDTAVADVSLPAGTSIAWSEGIWHVVYEKSGEIYHRARDAEGWLEPEPLTDDPGPSRNPHVSAQHYPDPVVHVVWEDDRTGHFEVWVRRLEVGQWSAEECLTCDDQESRAPVIAAEAYDRALVVWEEDAAPTAIQGRFFSEGAWGALQEISQSPAAAEMPTAGGTSGWADDLAVAWSDHRHGEPEIYLRPYLEYDETWGDEERLTDLPGPCTHPSLHLEVCCGDDIDPMAVVAYEHAAPTPEIRAVCANSWLLEDAPISVDDDIPSTQPAVGGFAFDWTYCWFGGPGPKHFLTWTDGSVPEAATHPVVLSQGGCPLSADDSGQLTEAGTSRSTVAAVEGQPEAGVLALWIEEIEGSSTLLAQRGSLLGCSVVELLDDPAPSLLLAPEGIPENVFVYGDVCSGQPEPNVLSGLRFSEELDATLTWDPLQDHPETEVTTNQDGEAIHSIRGGGCSQAGPVFLLCEWFAVAAWGGAKSPDIDGDCIVDNDDLDYVESKVGTDDFCADLDGSGVVDFEDVLLVTQTLWDHCSHITAVGEGGALPGPYLGIHPNPCGHEARLRLSLPGGTGAAVVRIVDVSGRIVRELRVNEAEGRTDLVWDTRDADGRRVASGVYYVTAKAGEELLRRPLLVLR